MTARIRVPKLAKRGEIVEIRTLLEHKNESGWRRDDQGKVYPRKIVTRFVCTYAGAEVVNADLRRGISANPYFAFFIRAEEAGDLVFRWEDESGAVFEEKARLEIV
ncbi:MAG: thiosulfate oxidation carrier complex protein SoxZ [Alphaproteobacteria bacterium]